MRPFFPLFLVAGIATYAYYAWPVDVTATQVFRGRAVEALPLRGTVEHEYATAHAEADGRVVEITVAEGNEVFEGEILARLERPEKIPEKVYVTAPMSGFVLGVDAEVGAQVAPGQPLFHIRTCCTRRVVVEVAEEKIVKLIVGQDAYVASDALPEEVFRAELKAIIPRSSSPGQGYLLHIPMQLGAPLEIGSRVNVDVIVRQEEDVILVPLDALTEGRVWVVEGKRAVRRKVEVGSLIDDRAHILSGLEDGEEIILNAPPELHAGRRIAVIKGPPTE
ncbi:MAG: efflux RND transporter periplasmic adaptor subunit [Alphaproteobacteria bacterium]|nr:efflux RND transporter periplasmic adaptor subunit [Alphaproteobacteria bacterium]